MNYLSPEKKTIAKFLVTGGLSTLIMYLVYLALNKVMNFQYSYGIAYVISVLCLYFMNAWFVFKKAVSLRSFLEFPFIYLLQYLIGALSLEVLVHYGLSITFAPLAVIVLTLPLTFVLNRWVLSRN
jgi:putative flippase GtrA